MQQWSLVVMRIWFALEAVNSFGKPVYVATWGGQCLSRSMRVHCYDIIDLRTGLESLRPKRNPLGYLKHSCARFNATVDGSMDLL